MFFNRQTIGCARHNVALGIPLSGPSSSAQERTMEWFSQNWIWVLFFMGFIAMHLFGHGRHGGHGGRHHDAKPVGNDRAQRATDNGSGHQH